MALRLSIRRLWKVYRDAMVKDGASKNETALAYDAFYCGGHAALTVSRWSTGGSSRGRSFGQKGEDGSRTGARRRLNR